MKIYTQFKEKKKKNLKVIVHRGRDKAINKVRWMLGILESLTALWLNYGLLRDGLVPAKSLNKSNTIIQVDAFSLVVILMNASVDLSLEPNSVWLQDPIGWVSLQETWAHILELCYGTWTNSRTNCKTLLDEFSWTNSC